MAFHPFRTFRKHKKVMFALLTIMCMLTFVLCAGYSARQEFFGKLLTDLISLIYQERWAPPVLCVALVLVALLSFFTARKQDDTTRSVTYYATAGGAVLLAVAVAVGIFLTRESKGAVTLYGKTVPEKTIAEVARKREIAKEVLTAAVKLGDEEISREERNAAGQKPGAEIIEHRIKQKRERYDSAYWRNWYYFLPKEPGASKLDYLVWQHQADLLGIHLTNAAIDAEVRHYTADTADMRQVLSQLTHSYRVEDVYAALRDEFRLRIAQEMLLGLEIGPELFAPYDFWTYYWHNLTSYHVALLPVAVADFIPKVAGSPDEDVRKNLYERFKDMEKNPLSDTPGFKEPRRIRVEWVSGNADLAYYRQEAEKALAFSQAARVVLSPTMQTNPGQADVAFAVYQAAPRDKLQIELSSVYETYKGLFLRGEIKRPEDAAAAAVGGPFTTSGNPVAIALAVLTGFQNQGASFSAKEPGNAWKQHDSRGCGSSARVSNALPLARYCRLQHWRSRTVPSTVIRSQGIARAIVASDQEANPCR